MLHQKEVFMILVGENLEAKIAQKSSRANLGKSGQNPSYPKNFPAPTPMMKRHLRPVAPLLKGQRGKQARNQLGTSGVAKSFLRGPPFLNYVV